MTHPAPFLTVFMAAACLAGSAGAYEKDGQRFMADPAFQSALSRLPADGWQESWTTSSGLGVPDVKFDNSVPEGAIIITAPDSAPSETIRLGASSATHAGQEAPVAQPVAPTPPIAGALPWAPVDMPPDDTTAFPGPDTPSVGSLADKPVETAPPAHDPPVADAATSPEFAQRDARQELWQEWSVKFDLIERENIALRDKLRAMGGDGLSDIRVDAVARIENESLRKRIAELEKQVDDLRRQAAEKSGDKAKATPRPPAPGKSISPSGGTY